ncbi:extracellular solute-binding protein [Paenibacillus alba]|uniref:ABC transporter substrate-binding protein n=1 Tax=Paenibacillus alba TaxID=1197127 RepID=UPI0015646F53|nr:extracellular solute-binding protein [Paenibacillus alba]NQX71388.1 extracellular solute-binding protein [Paenibacillus alba]
MRMMKTILPVLAALTVLAGCSEKSASPPKAEKAGTEPVKLSMWVRTPETLDLIKKSAEAFHQKYTNISIEVVNYAPEQYSAAIQAAVSGDSLPDIFQYHNSLTLSALDKLNLIQPIPFTDDFKQKFDPGTWLEGSTTLSGKVYAWPDRSFVRGPVILFYNKKLLADAGLAGKTPATWDDLIAQAKQVKEHSATLVPIVSGLKAPWAAGRIVAQLATTTGKAGLASEVYPDKQFDWKTGSTYQAEPTLESIQFLKQLIIGNLMSADSIIKDPPQANADFGDGKSAYMINGHWFVKTLLDNYKNLDFGVTTLPSKSGVLPYFGVNGGSANGYLISKKSKHTNEAAKWFEFLTENYYPELLKQSIDLTPIQSLNSASNVDMKPQFKELIQIMNQTVRVQPTPALINSVELETTNKLLSVSSKLPIGNIAQAYLAGGSQDVKAAVDNFVKEQENAFSNALKAVEGSSKDRWTFPDWTVDQNYLAEKYKNKK